MQSSVFIPQFYCMDIQVIKVTSPNPRRARFNPRLGQVYDPRFWKSGCLNVSDLNVQEIPRDTRITEYFMVRFQLKP